MALDSRHNYKSEYFYNVYYNKLPVKSHNKSHSTKSKTNNKSKLSNYDHRLLSDRKDNFPDGYLEEWSSDMSEPSNVKINNITNPATHNNSDTPPTPENIIFTSSNSILSEPETHTIPTINYIPVSIILSTQSNLLLSKDSTHDICFSTGMIEGPGITINDNGNEITFKDEGSYRFEICGDGAPFSDVDIKLIFYSESFNDDIRPFSEIPVPKDEGKLLLRGLATILPIHKNQKISPRLVAIPDESIVLTANTRLLIHRVA